MGSPRERALKSCSIGSIVKSMQHSPRGPTQSGLLSISWVARPDGPVAPVNPVCPRRPANPQVLKHPKIDYVPRTFLVIRQLRLT